MTFRERVTALINSVPREDFQLQFEVHNCDYFINEKPTLKWRCSGYRNNNGQITKYVRFRDYENENEECYVEFKGYEVFEAPWLLVSWKIVDTFI